MGTSLQKIFDAFLARITGDDWMYEEELELVRQDWKQFLQMAIFRFKYPRIELTIDESDEYFSEELTNNEIQVLAVLMKHEWVKRCVADWENIKQLYTDKDFSQANHLDKLIKFEERVGLETKQMETIYSRSIAGKPFDFTKIAGKNV